MVLSADTMMLLKIIVAILTPVFTVSLYGHITNNKRIISVTNVLIGILGIAGIGGSFTAILYYLLC